MNRSDPIVPTPAASIRVLIAEDHGSIREGIRVLLESERDFEVVGEAIDGRQAVEVALQVQPSSIVMSSNLPGLSGIDATRQIMTTLPDTNVVILSADLEAPAINAARTSGARGYVAKSGLLLQLPAVIRALQNGTAYISMTRDSDVVPLPQPTAQTQR